MAENNTRHAYHPLEQSKRVLDTVSDTGLGICALGGLMECADKTKIDDVCLFGLGQLLNVIGGQLLDSAHQCRELIDKPSE
ncbi:MAG: hypothetical protein AB1544_04115 [Pseudomonadota bacterium]